MRFSPAGSAARGTPLDHTVDPTLAELRGRILALGQPCRDGACQLPGGNSPAGAESST
jgi:hypothetical protein